MSGSQSSTPSPVPSVPSESPFPSLTPTPIQSQELPLAIDIFFAQTDADSSFVSVGKTVSVLLHESNNRSELSPLACSVQFTPVGPNNNDTAFRDVGGGWYELTLVAAPSTVSGPVAFSCMLRDNHGHTSPVISFVNDSLVVDSTAPALSLQGCPANGTVVKSSILSLLITCDDAISGCSSVMCLWNDTMVELPFPSHSNRQTLSLGPYLDKDRPLVALWAIDKAGNHGSPVVITWLVDLNFPVSVWINAPGLWLKQSEIKLAFKCAAVDCTVWYSLDGAAYSYILPVHASNSTSEVSSPLASSVDTQLIRGPPVVSFEAIAEFEVMSVFNGSRIAVDGTTCLLLLAIDAGEWLDARLVVGYSAATGSVLLTSLTVGVHTLRAKTVVGTGEQTAVDSSPVEYEWLVVDRTAAQVPWLWATSDNHTLECVWGTVDFALAYNVSLFVDSAAVASAVVDVPYHSWPVHALGQGLVQVVRVCPVFSDNVTGIAVLSPVEFLTMHWNASNKEDSAHVSRRLDASRTSDVTLLSYPASETTSSIAAFSFSSATTPPIFACSLDEEAFSPCYSGKRFGPLTVGTHAMTITIADADGNLRTEVPPVFHSWTILPSSTETVSEVGLTEGPHTLAVRAIDEVGNVEPSHVFSWTVVTTAPSVTAWLQSGNLVNSDTVVLMGRCVLSSVNSEGNCHVCVSVDGAQRQCFSTDTGGVFSAALSAPSEGIHTAVVTVLDDAGNSCEEPAVVVWTKDSVPPATQMTVAFFGRTYSAHSTPFVGTVASSGAVNVQVTVTEPVRGFVLWYDDTTFVDGGGTTVPLLLPDGLWRLRGCAVDMAGNLDPSCDVVTFVVDTSPPHAMWVVPPPVLSNSSLISLRVKAEDESFLEAGGFSVAVTDLETQGIVHDTFVSVADMTSEFTTAVDVGTSGRYNITVAAVDCVGNADVNPVWFVVTVDTEPPASRIRGPRFSNTIMVALSVNGSDALSAVALYYSVDNASAWFPVTSADGVIAVGPLSEGVHLVYSMSVDAAGNVEHAPFHTAQVVVDTTPPVAELSVVVPEYTNSPVVTACLSIEDASVVTLSAAVSSSSSSTVVVGNCVTVTTVDEGGHAVHLVATDGAGNPSNTVTVSWVYDKTAPLHVVRRVGCIGSRHGDIVCPSSDRLRLFAECDDVDAFWDDAVSSTSSRSPCVMQWQEASLINGSVSSGSRCDPQLVVPSGPWATLAHNESMWPSSLYDGRYVVWTRAVDGAGNIGPVKQTVWWLDTVPPLPPFSVQLKSSGAQALLQSSRTAHVLVTSRDTSPGTLTFWYTMSIGHVAVSTPMLLSGSSRTVDGVWTGELVFTDVPDDLVYNVSVWAKDQAGWFSMDCVSTSFVVLSTPPLPVVVSKPALTSGDTSPTIVLSASWPVASSLYGTSLEALSFVVSHGSMARTVLSTSSPECVYNVTHVLCVVKLQRVAAGQQFVQISSVMYNQSSDLVAVLWTHVICTPGLQFMAFQDDGNVSCSDCLIGMNCANPAAPVVARGFWATPASFQRGLFYKCPIDGACVGGMGSNGSRLSVSQGNAASSDCAQGYVSRLCSACDSGYVLQYGECHKCPATTAAAIGIVVGVVAGLLLIAGVVVHLRNVLPLVQLKVGVSMLQILAASNSAYHIPWPAVFANFLSQLKVVLVDVYGLIPAECTRPMTFYTSLIVTLVAFKLVLLVILAGPWAWTAVRNARCWPACVRLFRRISLHATLQPAWLRHARSGKRNKRKQASDASKRGWPLQAISLMKKLRSVEWDKVFKVTFMYMFFCYPGITLKLLRVFKCQKVEGLWYLEADYRLRCFTEKWWSVATYASIMLVVFTIGFPVAITYVLFNRRHKLFGVGSDRTRRSWGFLYEAYGASSWWWEVEELGRKLFLTSLVVVMDEGQPLQVTLAVLVSVGAHVLHAVYEPWGFGSLTYWLQHLSLTATSFVFLMGLLFKSGTLSRTSPAGLSFAVFMLLLCTVFVFSWVFVMVRAVYVGYRAQARARRLSINSIDSDHEDPMLSVSNPMRAARKQRRSSSFELEHGTARMSRISGIREKASQVLKESQEAATRASGNGMEFIANPMLSKAPKQQQRGVNPLLTATIDGVGPGSRLPGNPILCMSVARKDVVRAGLQAFNRVPNSKIARTLKHPVSVSESPIAGGRLTSHDGGGDVAPTEVASPQRRFGGAQYCGPLDDSVHPSVPKLSPVFCANPMRAPRTPRNTKDTREKKDMRIAVALLKFARKSDATIARRPSTAGFRVGFPSSMVSQEDSNM
jgi:hypothetical protein